MRLHHLRSMHHFIYQTHSVRQGDWLLLTWSLGEQGAALYVISGRQTASAKSEPCVDCAISRYSVVKPVTGYLAQPWHSSSAGSAECVGNLFAKTFLPACQVNSVSSQKSHRSAHTWNGLSWYQGSHLLVGWGGWVCSHSGICNPTHCYGLSLNLAKG